MTDLALSAVPTERPLPHWTNVGGATPVSKLNFGAYAKLRGKPQSKAPSRLRFAVTRDASPNAASSPLEGDAYLSILEVIKHLALGTDPDETVEATALLQACKVLEILITERWPAPRIHWHGGDAVVLSWKRGKRDILLTVTEEGQSLLEMRGGIVEKKHDSLDLADLGMVRPRVAYSRFYAYR